MSRRRPGRNGHDYDVIVIGSGHNGLVTAGYLAKAGYRVAVFERRHIVGGAVATEEFVPGYRFDVGGSAHILIRLTPIVEELELESHGLDYLELDPLFFAPFEDGDGVYFYRDVDRTVDEMERRFPSQGEAYKSFIDEWQPFAAMVRDMFMLSPSPFQLGRRMFGRRDMGAKWKDSVAKITQPYGSVLDSYLDEVN